MNLLGISVFLILLFCTSVVAENKSNTDNGPSSSLRIPFFAGGIDFRIDPCEDFYLYSCGNLLKKTKEGSTERFHENFLAAQEVHKCSDDSMMSNEPTNSTAILKMRQYRDAHFNKVSEPKLTVKQLLEEMKDFGCYGLHDNWSSETFNLSQTLFKMYQKTGKMYLMQSNVLTNKEEPVECYPSPLLFFDPNPVSKNMFETPNNLENLHQFFTDFYSLIFEQHPFPSSNFTKQEWLKNATEILVKTETELFNIYKVFGYFDNSWKSQIARTSKSPIHQLDYLMIAVGAISIYNEHLIPLAHLHLNTSYQGKFWSKINAPELTLRMMHSYYSLLLEKQNMSIYVCTRYLLDHLPYMDEEFQQLTDNFDSKLLYPLTPLYELKGDSVKKRAKTFPLVKHYLFYHNCFDKEFGSLRQQIGDELKKRIGILLKTKNLEDSELASHILSVFDKAITLLDMLNVNDVEQLDEYYKALDFHPNDSLWQMDRKIQFFEQIDSIGSTTKKKTQDLSQRMQLYKEIYDFSTENIIAMLDKLSIYRDENESRFLTIQKYAINGVAFGNLLLQLIKSENIFGNESVKIPENLVYNFLSLKYTEELHEVCRLNKERAPNEVYFKLEKDGELVVRSTYEAFFKHAYQEDSLISIGQFFFEFVCSRCGILGDYKSDYAKLSNYRDKSYFLENLKNNYKFSAVHECSYGSKLHYRPLCNSCQQRWVNPENADNESEYWCTQCADNCVTCSDDHVSKLIKDSTKCTQCWLEMDIQNYTTYSDICVTECPKDTYIDGHVCRPCDPICFYGCTGPTPNLESIGCKQCDFAVLNIKDASEYNQLDDLLNLQHSPVTNIYTDGSIDSYTPKIKCLNVTKDECNNKTCFDSICSKNGCENCYLDTKRVQSNGLNFEIKLCRQCPASRTVIRNDREQKCYYSVIDADLIPFLEKKFELIFGVFGTLLMAFLIGLIAFICIQRRMKRYSELINLPGFNLQRTQNRIENIPDRCEIPKEEITYLSDKPVGKGSFGFVYKGKWNHKGKSYNVAIKSIQRFSNNQKKHEETQIMSKLHHAHLVQFIGTFVSDGRIKIVTAWRPHGSLDSFLHTHQEHLKPIHMITYCWQIAKAMDHLSSLGIVHCDLATRNVLVRNPLHVEVTDFGLAHMIGEDPINDGKSCLPLPWIALELLNPFADFLCFSVETDVWSFGVTIWEIFTFGDEPFVELELGEKPNGRERLYQHLLEDKFLAKPKICKFELRSVMLSCWAIDPEDRPTFSDLSSKFELFLKTPDQYFNINTLTEKNNSKFRPLLIKSSYSQRFNVTSHEVDLLGDEMRKKQFLNNMPVQLRQPNILNEKQSLLNDEKSKDEGCGSEYTGKTVDL